MPLFGARHGAAGPGARTFPRHPAERWLPARILPTGCLRRLLPRRQESSTGGRESRFQWNVSRAGQSLRNLPMVEAVRRASAPR
jgi:hypothetical protein